MKTAPGIGNVEVRDVAEPATPPGHVKIAVRAAGICGTDLHIYRDEFRCYPPVVLGHEVAGEIAEVGTGVAGVAPGDRVTTETYISTCGHCRYCRGGRINLCPERRSLGSAVNGGFTSYVVVPERNVHHLPATIGFQAGALTEPLACAIHGAVELPRLGAGDLAVVAGPGAIGLLTMQVVRAAGAQVIVLGTEADRRRLDLASQLGASYVFEVERDSHRDAILELSGGVGADIVYECSGAGPAASTLLDVVRRGGQYAQIGLFGKPVTWDLDQICYKELSVTGSNASVPSAWERALRLLGSGVVRTEPLVTDVLPVTEWREAFDRFERRSGLKTLLQPVEG
ncbi:MAG TPA: zinc-binding dehydrogenase [Chloroflexota bacterium]|nr:zinc-binding dehydrogenase [Chloroflexota bacterium]